MNCTEDCFASCECAFQVVTSTQGSPSCLDECASDDSGVCAFGVDAGNDAPADAAPADAAVQDGLGGD
jgi:hypothetical protein